MTANSPAHLKISRATSPSQLDISSTVEFAVSGNIGQPAIELMTEYIHPSQEPAIELVTEYTRPSQVPVTHQYTTEKYL